MKRTIFAISVFITLVASESVWPNVTIYNNECKDTIVDYQAASNAKDVRKRRGELLNCLLTKASGESMDASFDINSKDARFIYTPTSMEALAIMDDKQVEMFKHSVPILYSSTTSERLEMNFKSGSPQWLRKCNEDGSYEVISPKFGSNLKEVSQDIEMVAGGASVSFALGDRGLQLSEMTGRLVTMNEISNGELVSIGDFDELMANYKAKGIRTSWSISGANSSIDINVADWDCFTQEIPKLKGASTTKMEGDWFLEMSVGEDMRLSQPIRPAANLLQGVVFEQILSK